MPPSVLPDQASSSPAPSRKMEDMDTSFVSSLTVAMSSLDTGNKNDNLLNGQSQQRSLQLVNETSWSSAPLPSSYDPPHQIFGSDFLSNKEGPNGLKDTSSSDSLLRGFDKSNGYEMLDKDFNGAVGAPSPGRNSSSLFTQTFSELNGSNHHHHLNSSSSHNNSNGVGSNHLNSSVQNNGYYNPNSSNNNNNNNSSSNNNNGVFNNDSVHRGGGSVVVPSPPIHQQDYQRDSHLYLSNFQQDAEPPQPQQSRNFTTAPGAGSQKVGGRRVWPYNSNNEKRWNNEDLYNSNHTSNSSSANSNEGSNNLHPMWDSSLDTISKNHNHHNNHSNNNHNHTQNSTNGNHQSSNNSNNMNGFNSNNSMNSMKSSESNEFIMHNPQLLQPLYQNVQDAVPSQGYNNLHNYGDQRSSNYMESDALQNINPHSGQIFYMAVPMKNGGGQLLQPVRMMNLPNGQTTFVVVQQQQPIFQVGPMTGGGMGVGVGVGVGGVGVSVGVNDDDDYSSSGNGSPPFYAQKPLKPKKEKRNKGKGGAGAPNAQGGGGGGTAATGELNKAPYRSTRSDEYQLSYDDKMQYMGSAPSTSDAISALYHSTQRPPLSSLLGHVRRLSRDQVGCRLLQQSLDEDGPHAATSILKEGLPFLSEAMTDPFGNYFFQKILEKVVVEERLLLIKTVSPRLVNAALNLHGTRSVQKVVEMSAIDDGGAAEIVTNALAPAAARLCIDSHGNHVIQRVLQKLPHKHSRFVFDAVAGAVGDVARHRHGCCVIQRCLDSPPSRARTNLVRRIVEKSLDLMQDAYGNYVVQYVLDVCDDSEAAAVCKSVVGRIGALAIQKFSSNVMEKCLERSNDRIQELQLRELSAPDKIRELMADPFGNYVVQKALSVATHAQAVLLVEAMRPHLPGMRNTASGRRILSKIVRRFPRFNLCEEELPPMPYMGFDSPSPDQYLNVPPPNNNNNPNNHNNNNNQNKLPVINNSRYVGPTNVNVNVIDQPHN